MPAPAAWWVGLAALSWGGWRGASEFRRPRRFLVWSADGVLWMDGVATVEPGLQWRGPLAFLRWRDGIGRRNTLAWWPDTLDAAGRRELRLAATRAATAALHPSMAP